MPRRPPRGRRGNDFDCQRGATGGGGASRGCRRGHSARPAGNGAGTAAFAAYGQATEQPGVRVQLGPRQPRAAALVLEGEAWGAYGGKGALPVSRAPIEVDHWGSRLAGLWSAWRNGNNHRPRTEPHGERA